MSSEISTEPQPAFEPWQLFTLAGLIGATIAVFMARGESPGAVIMISLTIFAVTETTFTVAVIPFTYNHTNISSVKKGDKVNIEFDMIGKYINRIAGLQKP